MKLLTIMMIFVISCAAASWDGQRGPFEVKTVTTVGAVDTTSDIFVRTTDLNVTAVRVTLTLLNPPGSIYSGKTRTWTIVADLAQFGLGVVTFTFPPDEIVDVRFGELREGVSH